MAKKTRSVIVRLLVAGIIIGACYKFTLNNPAFFTHLVSYCSYPLLKCNELMIEPVRRWQERRNQLRDAERLVTSYEVELARLRAENVELRAERIFFDDIKELNEFRNRYAQSGLIAQILRREITPQHHLITVNKGSRDGIREEMVALYNNALVGRVEHVYPWYSQVRLVTDKRCKVAVFCTKTHAKGIHYGCNECDESELVHVSHLEPVQEGDLVLSSGAGMVFPQGFALGTISSIKTAELYHEIKVKPLVDMKRIDHCVLVAKSTL